jgi:hypothetical protein
MALRADTQTDRVEFAGPYPAASRPLAVCGFARMTTQAVQWRTLIGMEADANNLTQLGIEAASESNLKLLVYQKTTGSNEIFEVASTGIGLNTYFFWGINMPSGTTQPTFFWRPLNSQTLSTSTPGGSAGTWTYAPTSIKFNYLSNLGSEWANAAQSGVRMWNRVLTPNEMLTESFQLRAKTKNGLILDVPCLRDARDLSVFGAGRVGTMTNMTVEDGPPIRY